MADHPYHHYIYGFRYRDTARKSLYEIETVGFQEIRRGDNYRWNGMTRVDGPLLLFQYTVGGCGALRTRHTTHMVPEETAIMVEIPSEHEYFLPDTSDRWEFYFILLRPNMLDEFWRELIGRKGQTPRIDHNSPVILLLKNIFYLASTNQIENAYKASSYAYQFVMELMSYNSAASRSGKQHWPRAVHMAVQFIEHNYRRLETIDDIAEHAGLSKYYFARCFKETTGYTPIQYLTKTKLERAIQLLGETKMTISEIAAAVGYSSTSYFIRVFRHWVGFSPGQFRTGGRNPVNQMFFN